MTIRLGLGYAGAVLMAAGGALHSLAGWPALRRTMAATTTPADVQSGLAVPWHFAGMAMVLFGVLVALDLRRGYGAPVATAIGIAYVLFGAAGMLLIKPDPTFALFIVPGLLVLAAPGRRRPVSVNPATQ